MLAVNEVLSFLFLLLILVLLLLIQTHFHLFLIHLMYGMRYCSYLGTLESVMALSIDVATVATMVLKVT